MTEQLSARDCFDIGYSAFHKNNLEEAKRYFHEAIEKDPEAHEAMNQLGIVALHESNNDQAIEWWLKSLAIEESAETLSNLGFYYSQQEQLDKAKPYIKRACQSDPSRMDAMIQWAYIESTEGNFSKAEELLQPLLSHEVAMEQAHLMLAQVKSEQKLFTQAIEVLEELVEKDPESDEALLKLAKTHWTAGQHAASAQYYRMLLKRLPLHIDIIKEYGTLLRDHIDTKKSIELFQVNLTWAGNDWELHFHLALALEKDNQPELARQSYMNALELNPTENILRQKVAWFNAKLANK